MYVNFVINWFGAILEIAEMDVLPHGSQETSIARSLVDLLPPRWKEGLAIDLGQLASHSLPLGSPSLARYANLNL